MRRWWPAAARGPIAVDVSLTAALIVLAVLLGNGDHPAGMRHFGTAAFLLTAAINLATLGRRRAPLSMLMVCCTLWTCYNWAGYWPPANAGAVVVALYTVASARSLRISVPAAALVAVTWLYAGMSNSSVKGSVGSAIAEAVVLPALVWRFGYGARRLAESNRRLGILTGQLRREQDERARRAVSDERIRIARELHDVVAHHMSVISVQAGLAKYVLRSAPATADAALETVLQVGGEALEEMRRMLVLLRIPDEPAPGAAELPAAEPAPGLHGLDGLLQRMRGAGLSLDLVVTGIPRALPPGLDLCAYRIIQESLTNVLKHAPNAHTTVTAHYGTRTLTIRVTNDGRSSPATPMTTSGQGLLGMAERAKIYGGTLTTAPQPQGGFEVELSLPLPNPPSTPQPAARTG